MISNRAAFALGASACAMLLATGYYLQYVEGQEPCPLCHVQRGFYYAVGVVFLAGALHGSATLAYAIAGFVLAAGGAATATRQVWLQHLPADQVPACGPDLFFMLENLPFRRTLEKLVAGSGECAEVKWRFLGLSIAEWSLGWFAALALLAAALLIRTSLRRASGATPRPQG
jgi:disulfide bond formation protein DsbB